MSLANVLMDGGLIILQVEEPFSQILIEGFTVGVQNLHWVLLGVLVGMILGTMPGMGGVVTLSVLIPFTIGMDKFSAFAMLTGALGATTFSGSITAILINTPGTGSNAATVIDGYPLTQQGRAGEAISISAVSSATGALVGGIIFLALLPVMLDFVLLFGPGDIFWLIVYAFLVIPLLIGDRPILGIAMAGLGAMFAFMGLAPQTGMPRFTFGAVQLQAGFHIIAVIVGLFALAEIYRLASMDQDTLVEEPIEKVDSAFTTGFKTVFKHKFLWLRCSILGTLVGAMPGAGGSAAAFIAYGHAAQSSVDTDAFGKGTVKGVLAPESANDAKDSGQLIPTLGLGVPGSGSMAVFLAGLVSHGIFPGPRLLVDETSLVVVILFAILVSNLATSAIGLVFVNQFTKILEVRLHKVLPAITILALTAVFITRFTPLDMAVAIGFGILGILCIYYNISRIPLVLAFVLAPILEENYYLATSYALGDHRVAFLTGALSWTIIALIAFSFFVYSVPKNRIPFWPTY